MTSATVRQARGAGRGEGYWMVVAVDVVALWGLCAYGSRGNLT